MYRRPPKESISSVAARIFHPTIVEHEYPILRTVCTSILSLTTPDNPDFRLNRMLVGLLGESRLTNEAIVRLWHRRLGHPGDTVLNELINLNPDIKIFVVDVFHNYVVIHVALRNLFVSLLRTVQFFVRHTQVNE